VLQLKEAAGDMGTRLSRVKRVILGALCFDHVIGLTPGQSPSARPTDKKPPPSEEVLKLPTRQRYHPTQIRQATTSLVRVGTEGRRTTNLNIKTNII